MCIRTVGFGFLAGLWLLAGAGCQKSSPGDAAPNQETPPASPQSAVNNTVNNTIARLHWLGKKRLEGETNAVFFMSIWDLPESAKLEAQTLHKLTLAIAGALATSTNPAAATNSAAIAVIRPLLEDLLKEESYLELRSGSNGPGELALAIRLNEDRAQFWETNLPNIFQQLSPATSTGSPAGTRGWQMDFGDKIKNHLALARVGTWTLLSLTRSGAGQAPSPALIRDFAARIDSGQAPFVGSPTNFWFEADLDLNRVAPALACDWTLPVDVPRIALTMTGDGLNVRTRGELTFSKPLGLEFEPWNIPTNLVHDPLVSFTAMNGIRPLLAALPGWTNLNVAVPPNQVYLWGMEGPAVETYFAAALPQASNAVYALGEKLMAACNPWLSTNKMGELNRATDSNGLSWKGFPFFAPFLKCVSQTGTGFAFGGIGPEAPLTNPPPAELFRQLSEPKQLVLYDWEVTGPRIDAAIYIGQLMRLMLHRAQLPEKCDSMLWLKAVSTKLGNCGTEIIALDQTHLQFVRKSGLGLTGVELQLLADWLESPVFPRSLHTLASPLPSQFQQRVASGGPTGKTRAPPN